MANGSTSSSKAQRKSTTVGSSAGNKTPSSSSTSSRRRKSSVSGSRGSSSKGLKKANETATAAAVLRSNIPPSVTAGPGWMAKEHARTVLLMLLDIAESGGGRREELQSKLFSYLEKRDVAQFSVLYLLSALAELCSEIILNKPLLKNCESPKGEKKWREHRKELQPDDAP